jgi:tRNA A-37 threonylcarbamoyl transferase component Bud32
MHTFNIYHRDIKTKNIIYIAKKWLYADFGIATATKSPLGIIYIFH